MSPMPFMPSRTGGGADGAPPSEASRPAPVASVEPMASSEDERPAAMPSTLDGGVNVTGWNMATPDS